MSAILKLFFIMYKLFSEIFFSNIVNLRVNSFLKNSLRFTFFIAGFLSLPTLKINTVISVIKSTN